jgi:hypothetical protein
MTILMVRVTPPLQLHSDDNLASNPAQVVAANPEQYCHWDAVDICFSLADHHNGYSRSDGLDLTHPILPSNIAILGIEG